MAAKIGKCRDVDDSNKKNLCFSGQRLYDLKKGFFLFQE